MKAIVYIESWTMFDNLLYGIVLLADEQESLEDVYNWCLIRYGKPQSQMNSFKSLWAIWRSWRWNGDFNSVYLSFNKANFTEFKLRWL